MCVCVGVQGYPLTGWVSWTLSNAVPFICPLHVAVCTHPDHLTDLLYRAVLYIAVQLRGITGCDEMGINGHS